MRSVAQREDLYYIATNLKELSILDEEEEAYIEG
jgi:hypothetical protein